MAEMMHLIGADDVRSAGHAMSRAAEAMSNAASTIDSALGRQRMFLETWLMQFEAAVAKINPPTVADPPKYRCECHRRMGNDFWFLPKDECLRSDGKCTERECHD